jgi:hypothetical protein
MWHQDLCHTVEEIGVKYLYPEVTGCFMAVYVVDYLPARYFSRGPKKWKSLG